MCNLRCEVCNEKSTVQSLSKSSALRIICLYRHLVSNKREFVLSKQLLRSGTSIGANIKEAQFAQSKADFIAKMYIALKEAGETEYWLELLHEARYLEYFATNKATSQETKNIERQRQWYLSDNETRKHYMTWQQELDDMVYEERELL